LSISTSHHVITGVLWASTAFGECSESNNRFLCDQKHSSVATGGGNGGNCLPLPNRRQTRSWDLRKSDEKHTGRNWGGGAPVVGRIMISLYCI